MNPRNPAAGGCASWVSGIGRDAAPVTAEARGLPPQRSLGGEREPTSPARVAERPRATGHGRRSRRHAELAGAARGRRAEGATVWAAAQGAGERLRREDGL